ncbi:MAG: CapA family protein [Lachnospiraceae bacterium]|nr:CapA family protein [Lachnospiraceae bacterium]
MGKRSGRRPDTDRATKRNNLAVFSATLVFVLFLGTILLGVLAYRKYLKTAPEKDHDLLSFIEALPEVKEGENAPAEPGSYPEGSSSEPEIFNPYADELADPDYMLENRIYTLPAVSPDEVTLSFTGDILFDDEYAVMATLKQRGGDLSSAIDKDALSILDSTDLTVVNNEFPYTDRGVPTEGKQFTFRAKPSTASYLNEMGADVAILANNHVLDFGETGLSDTLSVLKDHGVIPLGAGMNIEEASHPVYFILNGIKIGIVAATQIERNEYPNTKGATENSPGTFRCWSEDLIYDRIREADENSDFVIACIHWGTEKEEEPDQFQLSQGPKLAEAGADLIVGDHPHALQGFTYFGDTPCIFSLGNFWFNSSTLDTGILRVTVDGSGLKSLQFLPARQEECETKMVYDGEKERILRNMQRLSRGAVIDPEGFVTKGEAGEEN